LDVLVPLGIKNPSRTPALTTRAGDNALIEEMLRKAKAQAGSLMLGLYVGAGHPSRQWPLTRFAELAEWFARNDQVRSIVFTGPEERKLVKAIRDSFPKSALVFDNLSIPSLAAAMARLSVLVANDTGPLHLGAAVGTATVVLSDKRAPRCFQPIGDHHRVLRSEVIDDLSVEEVYETTRTLLASGRTAALFAS
jgi:ADP-heptose:LPS heptosyltransferase